MCNMLGLGDGGGVDSLRVCLGMRGMGGVGWGDEELNEKNMMRRTWVLLCSDKMCSALI